MKLLNSIFKILHVNKKNWKAIVLCILAATIFWFLNSFNENYTTNINFPLKFDFDTKNYIPVDPLPDQLLVNVTGAGWDLFRRSAGLRVPPLIIPLDRPSGVKKIVGSTLPALFSGQLQGLQINFVVNDTVYLNIEPRGRRWLTLSIDSVEKYIREDYGIIGKCSITPDSVLVEGPISMVTTLPEPYNINLDDRNIDEDFDDEIDVALPHGHLIRCNPSRVNVRFDVEEFVQVTDSVRLRLIHLPSSARPEMQISMLPLTIRIQRSEQSKVLWDSVRAVVDLGGFKKGNIKVLPTITGLPQGAEIIKIDTIQITY
jgi:YbbR domain-containing protein